MYSHFKIPFLDIKNYDLDINIVKIIPEEISKEYNVIAIDKCKNILTVGMVNPNDKNLICFLEQETKMIILPFQIVLSDLRDVILTAYIEKEINFIGQFY